MGTEPRSPRRSRGGRRPGLSHAGTTDYRSGRNLYPSSLPARSGPRGLLPGTGTRRRAAPPGARPGLPRQRPLRGCGPALPPERFLSGAGSLRRNLGGPAPPASDGARRRLPRFRRGRPLLRRRQGDSLAPRLGKPDRDRLFGRTGAVLAFPNVVHLLANEFPGLGRGRFPFSRVLLRGRERFFVRIGMHVTFRHSVHLEIFRAARSLPASEAPMASHLDRFPQAFVVLCVGSGSPGGR